MGGGGGQIRLLAVPSASWQTGCWLQSWTGHFQKQGGGTGKEQELGQELQ